MEKIIKFQGMGVIKAAAWAGLLVCMTLIFKTLEFDYFFHK